MNYWQMKEPNDRPIIIIELKKLFWNIIIDIIEETINEGRQWGQCYWWMTNCVTDSIDYSMDNDQLLLIIISEWTGQCSVMWILIL